jgi:hypothetical protein
MAMRIAKKYRRTIPFSEENIERDFSGSSHFRVRQYKGKANTFSNSTVNPLAALDGLSS